MYINPTYAFLLGAAVGSAITYWITTYEKRAILRVRRQIDHLGLFHKLSRPEVFRTYFPAKNLVNDEEVLKMYYWAMNVGRDTKKQFKQKWSAESLAAEAIICEKLFNIGTLCAIRTFVHCKTVDEFGDFVAGKKRAVEKLLASERENKP